MRVVSGMSLQYSLSMAESEPGGEIARSELRASHDDRDRVVELLRVSAGDGRLTAEELDERLEQAMTARTYGELARLVADLPAVGSAAGAGEPGDGAAGQGRGAHRHPQRARQAG